MTATTKVRIVVASETQRRMEEARRQLLVELKDVAPEFFDAQGRCIWYFDPDTGEYFVDNETGKFKDTDAVETQAPGATSSSSASLASSSPLRLSPEPTSTQSLLQGLTDSQTSVPALEKF